MATQTENGTIVGPGEQAPTGKGGSAKLFPNPAQINGSVEVLQPNPSYNSNLNGDSNVAGGGPAVGAQSSNNQSGGKPGTGTTSYGPTASSYTINPATLPNNFANQSNLAGNGQPPGASNYNNLGGNSASVNTNGPSPNQSDSSGRRVRLRAKPAAVQKIYGNSPILSPLVDTNGMIWPYQPTITYQQQTDYKSMELTHSNQDIYAYHRTPSLTLTVEGEFSVQNQQEGKYAIACIHFLRTVTKMNFGADDPYKGTPPPVLLFDAYGSYMFNQLPVIVTQFTVGLPKDVDYVPIDLSQSSLPDTTTGSWVDLTSPYLGSRTQDQTLWLPSVFNIQVTIIVQNSPTKLRSFNLETFRTGQLVKAGGWV
jgi:hypothetical protein